MKCKIYHQQNKLRFDPTISHIAAGVVYNGCILNFPDALACLGVVSIEVDYPEDYSEESYSISEQDYPPYLVFKKMSEEDYLLLTQKKFEKALDTFLDDTAKLYKYDNRFTFSMRAGYAGPYQKEALQVALWMDECNVLAYKLLVAVSLGEAPMPESTQAFISTLPILKITTTN